MYFLAWKWTQHRLGACVAGMMFATNGLTLNSLMWPNNISALGWMPWVVLLAEQSWRTGGRGLLLAVFVGAMQMLAGAPEVVLLTWLFVLILGAGRFILDRRNRGVIARRLIASIILIAGLAAAQLLPFLDLLLHSQRDQKFFESVWPMPGTGWANLLVPLFHCMKTSQGLYFQPDQYWTTSYYMGAGTLTVAVLAALMCRRKKVLLVAAITLLGLILAMGSNGYLYVILKKALPVIGFMRFPIKFVVWVVFSLPLLAAYGVRMILAPGPIRGVDSSKLLLGLSVTVTVFIGLLIWFAYLFPGQQEQWTDTVVSGLSRAGFLWAGIGLVFMLRRPTRLRSRVLIGSAMVLLAGFDPMTYAHQKTPTAPRAAYDPNIVSLDPRPEPGQSRVVTTYWAHQNFNKISTASPLNDFVVKRLGLFANCNLLEGIPKLDGFYSLYLREPQAIWSLFYFQTNNDWVREIFSSTNQVDYAGLLDFIGASYLSSPKKYYEWTPRTNYLPLATGGQAPVFADDIAALRGLVRSGFDPRREVFLPLEAGGEISVSGATAPKLSATYGAQRIVVEVSTEKPTWLVLSQSHYHPWVAYQDGKPSRIWKANFAFQAVAVPSGRHIIRLAYEDWLFTGGAVISSATLAWLAWRFGSGGRVPSRRWRR